jgi:hypothetical protein
VPNVDAIHPSSRVVVVAAKVVVVSCVTIIIILIAKRISGEPETEGIHVISNVIKTLVILSVLRSRSRVIFSLLEPHQI